MKKTWVRLLLITAAIIGNATVASGESVSKSVGSRPNIIVCQERLSVYHNGLERRLTKVEGEVIREVVA